MSIKGKAYIAGIFEHPTRLAKDLSLAQIHAEVAKGALEDAGLTKDDVDGYFCAGDAPGLGPMSMVEYMGLKPRHVDSTDTGGSSYLLHVAHAAEAIAMGKCKVALITLAGAEIAVDVVLAEAGIVQRALGHLGVDLRQRDVRRQPRRMLVDAGNVSFALDAHRRANSPSMLHCIVGD